MTNHKDTKAQRTIQIQITRFWPFPTRFSEELLDNMKQFLTIFIGLYLKSRFS